MMLSLFLVIAVVQNEVKAPAPLAIAFPGTPNLVSAGLSFPRLSQLGSSFLPAWTPARFLCCFQVLLVRFRKANSLYKICTEKEESLSPTKSSTKTGPCWEIILHVALWLRALSGGVTRQRGLRAVVFIKTNSLKDIGIKHLFLQFLACKPLAWHVA